MHKIKKQLSNSIKILDQLGKKHLAFALLCICFTFLNTDLQAQVPSKKPKKEKVIPRFPPQYNAAEVARKKDSIARLNQPQLTKKPIVQKPQINAVDLDYKLISSTTDANGNKVEVIEKKVKGYTIRQTIRTIGHNLNVAFNADTINKDSIKIVIDKTKYRMSVFYKRKFLTSYRCVFGIQPIGQKMYEGDKRTPEGDFKITETRPHGEWSYFYGINYPTDESRTIYQQNLKTGKIPGGAGIGGAVGIHGMWEGGDAVIADKHNWTDGCIALNKKDVTELGRIIKQGTAVKILK